MIRLLKFLGVLSSFPLAVGIRSMADEVNRADASNDMYRHPEDFELYDLGVFDDSTGVITPCEPHCAARAKDLVEAPKES